MEKIICVATISLFISACASHTNEIQAQYISPMEYHDYTCSQIAQEMAAVNSKASEVGAVVDKQASNDSAQMGVGLILLWPTLFFLDGDTPQAAEYSKLKGEIDALNKAAIQKNCTITTTATTSISKTTKEQKR